MSWLFLDTADPRQFRCGLIGYGTLNVRTFQGRSQKLLPALFRRFPHLTSRSIDGICAVVGPGSFSSIRGGVLVANVLSRIIRVPLVGIVRSEAEELESLSQRLTRGEMAPVRQLAPIYDAEPNITC